MEPISPSSSLSSSSSCKRKRDVDDSFDDESNSYDVKPKNDVFLNYSFEDIGKGFISHLLGALRCNGFLVSDHTMLRVGENVCIEQLKAIRESEICVPVFSRNYASSVRCLDELVDIMDSHQRFNTRKVVPVFFDVATSDVSSQKGPFMKAFEAHQTNVNPHKVKRWRQALKYAAQLSGLTLRNGDEANFVIEIVEELEKMQSPQELHITDHPVGIGSRAEELISKLRLSCKDVLVVAVFGVSGIGKTTIVKAAYNRIAANFDVSCFIADIHYLCGGPNWKVDLPKELVSCLTRNDRYSIKGNHNESITRIRRLISHRKALLVLDDVDNFQQLEALGINPKWFYNGSRIIVTTRDKQSLGNIPYVSYYTKLLNERESFNLFTRLLLAKDDEPANSKFIEEIATRSGGIPLVLKVWSCHFKQYERGKWPSILERLKRIPHGDVQKQLQMSYDLLPTKKAKKLFLDIACFFVGMKKDIVVKVLQDEDSGFFADIEIQHLLDKGLVEIDQRGCVLLPHVIREMGQEVVRQENEDEPGHRTRLISRDAVRVLEDCSGTKSVESISSGWREQEIIVQVKALRKMSNLRLINLQQYCRTWSSSHDEMSPLSFKKLKYMECTYFPFKSIDMNIDMCNVVVLRFHFSELEILWEGIKSLKKLRILDVAYSTFLTRTGNFFGLENLEELCLNHCEQLEELHSSIGCLDKLVLLNLSHCTKLKRFPWEMIVKLKSLQTLNLSHCPNIKFVQDGDFQSSLKESYITWENLSHVKLEA